MNSKKAKMLRKHLRHAIKESHREVWLALCAGPPWRRLVLGMRLMCGRPFGVWKKGKKIAAKAATTNEEG